MCSYKNNTNKNRMPNLGKQEITCDIPVVVKVM